MKRHDYRGAKPQGEGGRLAIILAREREHLGADGTRGARDVQRASMRRPGWRDQYERVLRLECGRGAMQEGLRFEGDGGQQLRTLADFYERDRRWKEAANTEWTTKMRPHFRDGLRIVLRRYERSD